MKRWILLAVVVLMACGPDPAPTRIATPLSTDSLVEVQELRESMTYQWRLIDHRYGVVCYGSSVSGGSALSCVSVPAVAR